MSLDPVSSVLDLVNTVVSRIWPDKTEVAKEQFILALKQELDQTQLLQAQTVIDTAEAGSTSVFVAGWRPLIGWICGAAFAWAYLGQPMIAFICAATGHPIPNLPVLNTGDMMTVLMGMLGLGSLRTWEKVNNVQNKH